MKKTAVILIILFLSFVCASAEADNPNLKKIYTPFELISGSINLTLEHEPLNSIFSTNVDDNKISLRDFLDANKIVKDCQPIDCSNNYGFSDSAEQKNFSVDSNGTWFGFVVNGNIKEIQDFEFSVLSDFDESSQIPLEFQFFDDKNFKWRFDKASEIFGDMNWSCYNASAVQETGDITQNIYCEKFYLKDIPAMKVGGDIITEDGTGDVEMKIYDAFGQEKAKCSFNPHNEKSCIAKMPGGFSGEYAICIRSDKDNGYDIKTEKSGKNCGWLGKPSTADSTRDFAIFMKPGLYAKAEKTIVKSAINFNLILSANFYIYNKYLRNCSGGCVIPVFARGASQNLQISNVKLKYTSDLVKTETNVYKLNIEPAQVNFKGKLDLKFLGFEAGSKGKKNLKLYLGNTKLIDEDIEVLPAPIIRDIQPRNIPAGVEIFFIADADSEYNISSYLWNFGDGTKITSKANGASHVYNKIGSYTIILNATDIKGITASKSFPIVVGSPREIINNIFAEKKKNLNDTFADIGNFSDWQARKLREILNIENYAEEIDNLEKMKKNASTDNEFLEIALSLQELDIPRGVFTSSQRNFLIIPDAGNIKPEIIGRVSGESAGSFADTYRGQIASWQLENIEGRFETKEISVLKDSGREVILNSYALDFNAGNDAYFVVNKPRDELSFKTAYKFKNDSFAVFSILKGANNIEFASITGEAGFFFSPKLSTFLVGIEIGECNFNGVCESGRGENSSNCPNDCKPIGKAILYILLALFIVLVIYTMIQVWYMLRYENYLFRDRRYLFNLLNFIDNARKKLWDDRKIRQALKEQGWNGEQIIYALKKSRGERTGLLEIIPVSKIADYYEKKKALKSATENIGQNMGKFNK